MSHVLCCESGLYQMPQDLKCGQREMKIKFVTQWIIQLSALFRKKLKAFCFEMETEMCRVSHISVTQNFVFCSLFFQRRKSICGAGLLGEGDNVCKTVKDNDRGLGCETCSLLCIVLSPLFGLNVQIYLYFLYCY